MQDFCHQQYCGFQRFPYQLQRSLRPCGLLSHRLQKLLSIASSCILRLPAYSQGFLMVAYRSIQQEIENNRSYRSVCRHNIDLRTTEGPWTQCFRINSCAKLSNSWPSFTEFIHIQDGQARHILCYQVAHVHPRRPNAHFSNPNVAVDLIWKWVNVVKQLQNGIHTVQTNLKKCVHAALFMAIGA